MPKSNDAEPKATRDRPLNLGEAKELLKAWGSGLGRKAAQGERIQEVAWEKGTNVEGLHLVHRRPFEGVGASVLGV